MQKSPKRPTTARKGQDADKLVSLPDTTAIGPEDLVALSLIQMEEEYGQLDQDSPKEAMKALSRLTYGSI